MAEPTQFSFTWKEIAEILIKAQNLHEGKWVAGIEFGVNIGMLTTSPQAASPGAMVLGNRFTLTKTTDGAPPNLVVDAALVNPKK